MKAFLQFISLLILLAFTQNSFAQHMNYETDTGFDIGFGFGSSSQKSDVANSLGFGGDFTFGHSLYQKENAFWSLDWRFRFLAGNNRAYDHHLQIDSTYNNVNYTHFNYDLEFVLTMNKLRNKTGIILSGFAGAGIAHNITKFDLVDGDRFSTTPYDYSSINTSGFDSQEQINQDLISLTDGKFETKGVNNAAITPTLGFYIGYQFGPRFSMGIEHKVNYFLQDHNSIIGSNIDGVIGGNSLLDRNRYTSLGFKWDIGGGGSGSTGITPTGGNTPSGYTNQKPRVTITDPQNNPHKTTINTHVIKAKIYHVNNYNDVTFFQDGMKNMNFTFNPNTNDFEATVQLKRGGNTFRIFGKNAFGSDEDNTTIILEDAVSQLPPPRVNIYTPQDDPHYTDKNTALIESSTRNVYKKEDISLTVNGVAVPFNFINKKVQATVALTEGENEVVITGVNTVGSDTDKQKIIYKKLIKKLPPTVTITNPAADPYETENDTHFVHANTTQLTHRNQLKVTVNNNPVYDFQFNNKTGAIRFNANLVEGQNLVVIKGENEVGKAQDQTTIIYKKPITIVPPVVTILIPETDPYSTYNANEGVTANVLNVALKNQITVNINGLFTSNFNYNATKKLVTLNVALKEGQNTIKITAKNEAGIDSDSQIIIKEIKPCPQPEVSLNYPTTNTFETKVKTLTSVLTTQNASSVQVIYNNANFNNFQFDKNSGIVKIPLNLSPGNNSIRVIAKNECGQKEVNFTIKYEEEIIPPCNNPVVAFKGTSNQKVNTSTTNIQANVTNVLTSNQIALTVNGNGAAFNYNNGSVTSNINLAIGLNNIVLTATNECGSDTKTFVVNYAPIVIEEEPCVKPIVNFSVTENNGNDATHLLNGTVKNIKNKTDVTITVNGAKDNGFQFVPNTTELDTKFKLEPGTHTIVVTATNECGTDTKSTTITIEEEPCLKPIVNFSVTENNGNDATHLLNGTVKNIKNKTDVTITVNGAKDNGFQFVPNTTKLDTKFKLEPGTHTIVVMATNECGTDTKSTTITIEEEPCESPKINIITNLNNESEQIADNTVEFVASALNIKEKSAISVKHNDNPINFNFAADSVKFNITLVQGNNKIVITATNECGADAKSVNIFTQTPCDVPVVEISSEETEDNYKITGLISNVSNTNDISFLVNGKSKKDFSFENGTFEAILDLPSGTNTVVVNATTSCGTDSKTITIDVEEEQCGPRFNPGNSVWQFCLITPNGIYNRDDLANNGNFTYSGSASSLYFSPIAGGGDALVNGQPYSIQTGKYYHFEGNLTVSVTSKHPGAMGHWMVCVDSDTAPKSGNGNNRPKSPCETEETGNGNANGNGGNNSGNNGNGNGNGNSGGNGNGNNASEKGSGSNSNNQQKVNQEAEETKKAEEEEAKKKAILDAERKQQEQEAAKKKALEEQRRKAATEAAAKKRAADQARIKAEAQRKAQEEARKKAALEAQRKRAAAEAARKKQAQESAKKKALEEQRRKAAAESAAKKRAADQARAKAEAQRKAQEAARKKAEEAKKKTDTSKTKEPTKNGSTKPTGPKRLPR